MTIDEIKEKLRKKAVIFTTGGKRPTKTLLESWIGAVFWRLPNETNPVDQNGNHMEPIMTLFLKDLPYRPQQLQGIELITIFMSNAVWDHMEQSDLSNWFHIRSYTTLEGLQFVESASSIMQPYPLIPNLVENDFPTWEGLLTDPESEEIILKAEEEEEIDYFDDVVEEIYAQHKIGGYPAFRQSGFDFGADYPFVLQVSSDGKAGFNIVDDGNFYFFFNKEQNDWKIYCDFY